MAESLLKRLGDAVARADLHRRHGRVSDLIGLIVEATGLEAEVGEVCEIATGRGRAPIGDNQIRFQSPAMFDELSAVFGYCYHLMPKARQDLLKEVPHFGLVVGDGNSQSACH